MAERCPPWKGSNPPGDRPGEGACVPADTGRARAGGRLPSRQPAGYFPPMLGAIARFFLSLSLACTVGCATSVDLGDLIREGQDNPRRREPTHTGARIAVTGKILDLEYDQKQHGHEVRIRPTLAGARATVKPVIGRYVIVDLRPASFEARGYARCRFRKNQLDDDVTLRGGQPFAMVGEFKGYRRTPQGLRAELRKCEPD